MTCDSCKHRGTQSKSLDKSLVKVSEEVVRHERHIRLTKDSGARHCAQGGNRHINPLTMTNPVRPASNVREMKLMYGGDLVN